MEEKAILEKLDRILEILGEGRGRSTADLRRQAEADVIRLMVELDRLRAMTQAFR